MTSIDIHIPGIGEHNGVRQIVNSDVLISTQVPPDSETHAFTNILFNNPNTATLLTNTLYMCHEAGLNVQGVRFASSNEGIVSEGLGTDLLSMGGAVYVPIEELGTILFNNL